MPLTLPAENRALSPFTGYTREHWAAIADHLLLSLRPHFSPTRARVLPPGRSSAYGPDSDGLEGFARSFLLLGFRLVGEGGADPHGFLDWYRDGLIAGTDPENPERWPIPSELGQAKVEAASIALILQMTRPWLWDTLDAERKQRVIDWFATVIGTEYPANNWLWFRLTVETFLASVGGPHSLVDVLEDLDEFESFYREGGWYSDSASLRAFDYYSGWALQLYPHLWADAEGSEAFGSRALRPVWHARLADYLDDYASLIGSDGVPLIQGRSLIYRFAAAAPLWAGAYTGATRLSPGAVRRAASGILTAFVERGSISDDGLLTLGLFGEWPDMAQSYSGSGSPYWAAKGMLGLALPADHPVWTAVEEPLPVERGDVRRVIAPAGWTVSGTASDGLVRVLNHGTDHAAEGDLVTDSPIYARYGYSTATIPPLTGTAAEAPADNSIVAVDAAGELTHRAGFRLTLTGDDGAAAYAASLADLRWVDTSADTGPDHGSGRGGTVTCGPRIAAASLVRGAWEVRVAHVIERGASAVGGFVASGWPIVGEETEAPASDGAVVAAGGLVSEIVSLAGAASGAVHVESGTSPLGETTRVPHLALALSDGETGVFAVRLSREGAEAGSAPTAHARVVQAGLAVEVGWADGSRSAVTVPLA